MNRVLACCVIASLFSFVGCTVKETKVEHDDRRPVVEREKTVVVPEHEHKTEVEVDR